MNLKYLLPVFAEAFRSNSALNSAVTESKNMFQAAIREEVLSLAMKIFAGLILCSVIIFSLISVGQQANILMLTLENGPYLSMIVFACVAIACGAGLFYIFYKPKSVVTTPPLDLGINLQRILLNFYDGLNAGIEKSMRKKEVVEDEAYVPASHNNSIRPIDSPNMMPNYPTL